MEDLCFRSGSQGRASMCVVVGGVVSAADISGVRNDKMFGVEGQVSCRVDSKITYRTERVLGYIRRVRGCCVKSARSRVGWLVAVTVRCGDGSGSLLVWRPPSPPASCLLHAVVFKGSGIENRGTLAVWLFSHRRTFLRGPRFWQPRSLPACCRGLFLSSSFTVCFPSCFFVFFLLVDCWEYGAASSSKCALSTYNLCSSSSCPPPPSPVDLRLCPFFSV